MSCPWIGKLIDAPKVSENHSLINGILKHGLEEPLSDIIIYIPDRVNG